MIFDSLDNLFRYASIPYQSKILSYLKTADFMRLPDGDTEIEGQELFVRVLRYEPKPAPENNFETHKHYADIQVILKGVEKMQVVNADFLTDESAYNKEGDYQFYNAEENISELVVRENNFVVFFPGEPHKPGCYYKKLNEPVFKIVFKARVE